MSEAVVEETPGADASPDTEVEAEVEKPESEAESPPAEAPKEPDPFQERIDKLTRRFRETERSAKEKDAEIAELKKQLSAKPKERAPGKTLADFEYDNEKYLEYRLEQVRDEARAEAQEVASRLQGKARAETAFQAFQRREAEFAKKVNDYQATTAPERWVCSELMAAEIHQSEMGPELAYHLAKNPDVALEIYHLPERDAIRQLAMLEVKLGNERAKVAPNKVSGAPPPPPKIPASDAGLEKDPAKMSDAEFAKWRRKQIANR